MARKWTHEQVKTLFDLPFTQLLYKAQTIHRRYFKTDEIELCTLLNIKTGTCPEDCAYCSQSGHHQTAVIPEKLLDVDAVVAAAQQAKASGARRFCMGAAWRSPPIKQFPKVIEMIKAVKNLGLETCVTLGMLSTEQAEQLKIAGLDYYNHNLDTSPNYYPKIISTRTYQDRLDTLTKIRQANIHVCCGGIIGMGETQADRIELLIQLASLNPYPESVTINRLIPIAGTPLAHIKPLNNFEFIRNVAIARIMMPKAKVRLSAGRAAMSPEMQSLCFIGGANSIHVGEKLLTTKNANEHEDMQMLKDLGLKIKKMVV